MLSVSQLPSAEGRLSHAPSLVLGCLCLQSAMQGLLLADLSYGFVHASAHSRPRCIEDPYDRQGPDGQEAAAVAAVCFHLASSELCWPMNIQAATFQVHKLSSCASAVRQLQQVSASTLLR
mmetsp:Transcript_5230/g.7350  ORF Transcript_5230/g.7350 Transcript_5230/m.7350 type:complete len:121 (-) Transcript_5230:187-549(-)